MMSVDNLKTLVGIFVAGSIFGAVFLQLSRGMLRKLWRGFSSNAPLIKKYWLFVVPFIAISALSYWLVLRLSSLDRLNLNIDILGQVLTLVFAIFVGYYAFLQVVENRLEHMKELAVDYIRTQSYTRAILLHEEIHSIVPRDVLVLSNLLELYLLVRDYEKFQIKITALESCVIEDTEKLWVFYLKIARYLLKQHLTEAKDEIAKCILHVKKSPRSLLTFSWSFKEMKDSDAFKTLEGDPKSIFDNFIAYLSKKLPEEKKAAFEGGNYLLHQQEPIQS